MRITRIPQRKFLPKNPLLRIHQLQRTKSRRQLRTKRIPVRKFQSKHPSLSIHQLQRAKL
ncbi:unnamed protein product [Dibothriocephalus latus]|uniref:Uncharacterized protein n=1 Tax=Dibothriocephalus latus TaxID=60516 RepID=A0A3P7MEJ2_DIBLA|nr:unnamed protein product [Dibothriocephalus latus]